MIKKLFDKKHCRQTIASVSLHAVYSNASKDLFSDAKPKHTHTHTHET